MGPLLRAVLPVLGSLIPVGILLTIAFRAASGGASDLAWLALLGALVGLSSCGTLFLAGRGAKRRAANLNRLLDHQQILIDATGEGIFGIDPGGGCVYVNPAGARLIGLRVEAILGAQLTELLTTGGEAVEGTDAFGIATAIRGGEGQLVESMLWRPDGSTVEVECLTSVVVGNDADIAAVVAIRDITERKVVERGNRALLQAEKALREKAEAAEQRAKFLAEASDLFATSLEVEPTLQSLASLVVPQIADSCVIYLMTETGTIQRLQPVHVDPEQQRVLAEQFERYPPELNTLVPPVKRALLEGQASLLGRVTEEAMKAIPGDQTHRSVVRGVGLRSLIAVPLRARGRILGAITYGVSTSGRTFGTEDLALADELASRAGLALDNARLYQKARSAVRVRNEVLGIVSHDLRNPLNAVHFGSQALLRHWPPRDEGTAERNQLVAIGKAAERMRRLINDLLDIAQIEAGKLKIDVAEVPVANLVAEALNTTLASAAERSIKLTLDVPERMPSVVADSGRILQVLNNLLHNAIKFSPVGGEVEIGAYEAAGEVVFAVHDRGTGIEEESLPTIFDGFWRGNRGKGSGAGLGLTIARGIVESHRGRIWVSSRVGYGSTFFFSVPSAPSEVSRELTDPAEVPAPPS